MNQREHLLIKAMMTCADASQAMGEILLYGEDYEVGMGNSTARSLAKEAFTKLVAVMEMLEETGLKLVANHTTDREQIETEKSYRRRGMRIARNDGMLTGDDLIPEYDDGHKREPRHD